MLRSQTVPQPHQRRAAVGAERIEVATAPRDTAAQQQVNGLVEDALPQGSWLDADYLWLTDRSRHLVEYTDGYLEILPMPTRGHQRIVAFLYSAFRAFLKPAGGEALFAPLRLRVRLGKFREPDLIALRNKGDVRSGDRFWTGADVVLEVVSPDNPERDRVQKRQDYAEAGIPEYWIVDPAAETIHVLRLEAGGYVEHSVCGRAGRAASFEFAGFVVDAAKVFDAGEGR